MKLLRCVGHNFGSYKAVDLWFDQNLTLIHGKTGSGKSTLPDLPCWILFGVTAKDGAANDVINWKSNEDVRGDLTLELRSGETLHITRKRGTKNDLYWIEGETRHRGKDLTETQKLLNKRLGFNAEVYLSAAYFCEFSPSAAFFYNSAKDRRSLFENIAPLELPTKLAESITEEKRRVKRELSDLQSRRSNVDGRLLIFNQGIRRAQSEAALFASSKVSRIKQAREKIKTFEDEKKKEIIVWQEEKDQKTDKLIRQIESKQKEIIQLQETEKTFGCSRFP